MGGIRSSGISFIFQELQKCLCDRSCNTHCTERLSCIAPVRFALISVVNAPVQRAKERRSVFVAQSEGKGKHPGLYFDFVLIHYSINYKLYKRVHKSFQISTNRKII